MVPKPRLVDGLLAQPDPGLKRCCDRVAYVEPRWPQRRDRNATTHPDHTKAVIKATE
jgi:hypothetical protein